MAASQAPSNGAHPRNTIKTENSLESCTQLRMNTSRMLHYALTNPNFINYPGADEQLARELCVSCKYLMEDWPGTVVPNRDEFNASRQENLMKLKGMLKNRPSSKLTTSTQLHLLARSLLVITEQWQNVGKSQIEDYSLQLREATVLHVKEAFEKWEEDRALVYPINDLLKALNEVCMCLLEDWTNSEEVSRLSAHQKLKTLIASRSRPSGMLDELLQLISDALALLAQHWPAGEAAQEHGLMEHSSSSTTQPSHQDQGVEMQSDNGHFDLSLIKIEPEPDDDDVIVTKVDWNLDRIPKKNNQASSFAKCDVAVGGDYPILPPSLSFPKEEPTALTPMASNGIQPPLVQRTPSMQIPKEEPRTLAATPSTSAPAVMPSTTPAASMTPPITPSTVVHTTPALLSPKKEAGSLEETAPVPPPLLNGDTSSSAETTASPAAPSTLPSMQETGTSTTPSTSLSEASSLEVPVPPMPTSSVNDNISCTFSAAEPQTAAAIKVEQPSPTKPSLHAVAAIDERDTFSRAMRSRMAEHLSKPQSFPLPIPAVSALARVYTVVSTPLLEQMIPSSTQTGASSNPDPLTAVTSQHEIKIEPSELVAATTVVSPTTIPSTTVTPSSALNPSPSVIPSTAVGFESVKPEECSTPLSSANASRSTTPVNQAIGPTSSSRVLTRLVARDEADSDSSFDDANPLEDAISARPSGVMKASIAAAGDDANSDSRFEDAPPDARGPGGLVIHHFVQGAPVVRQGTEWIGEDPPNGHRWRVPTPHPSKNEGTASPAAYSPAADSPDSDSLAEDSPSARSPVANSPASGSSALYTPQPKKARRSVNNSMSEEGKKLSKIRKELEVKKARESVENSTPEKEKKVSRIKMELEVADPDVWLPSSDKRSRTPASRFLSIENSKKFYPPVVKRTIKKRKRAIKGAGTGEQAMKKKKFELPYLPRRTDEEFVMLVDALGGEETFSLPAWMNLRKYRAGIQKRVSLDPHEDQSTSALAMNDSPGTSAETKKAIKRDPYRFSDNEDEDEDEDQEEEKVDEEKEEEDDYNENTDEEPSETL